MQDSRFSSPRETSMAMNSKLLVCWTGPLLLLAGSLSGCQGLMGGPGSTAGAAEYYWLAGNAVKDYPVPKSVAAKAVADAMVQMAATTVRSAHSTRESTLEYKSSDGTIIGIHLEEEHPPPPAIAVRTVISVRVGALGDTEKSEQLFLAISRGLSLPVSPGAEPPGKLTPIPVSPLEYSRVSGAIGPGADPMPQKQP